MKFYQIILFLVIFFNHSVFSERGAKFIDIQAIVEPVNFLKNMPAGIEVGLQHGVNSKTDISFNFGALFVDGKSDGYETNLSLRLASYFTPYFGDIHPKFGGSIGLDKYSSETKPQFLVSGHIMGLYDISDSMNFYFQLSPGYVFSERIDFFTRVGLGLQFRLGK